jgi:UDPglucose 6-dehydrogenase
MKISVIGAGYVGCVTGICLAEIGHDVFLIDVDSGKLEALRAGKCPVFEPGLNDLLAKNHRKIRTTPDVSEAIQETELTLICVGTPQNGDGSVDLRYVIHTAQSIGRVLRSKNNYHTIVVKSTVLPGTTENVLLPVLESESGKRAHQDFGIATNPEFLKEGCAVQDFFHTDRIIIGAQNQKTTTLLEELYKPLNAPVFNTNIKTAEMIKYVSNAFLATKISFANEVGNMCKAAGIDTYEVFKGVGMDTRINPHFFRSGIGFGGSCFPKDVQALIHFAELQGVDPKILKAIIATNNDQPLKMINLLKNHLDIKGKKIGVLGLAFKPGTDDIRESRAVPIIRQLLAEGAEVVAYDPLAMPSFSSLFPGIRYAQSAQEAINADAVFIVTEWDEFEDLDYQGRLVIDGRRIKKAQKEAAQYEGICW